MFFRREKYDIDYEEQQIQSELKTAFARVVKDPDIRRYRIIHPEVNKPLNEVFRRDCSTIVSNVSSVKKNHDACYQSLVEERFNNIGETISSLSKIHNVNPSDNIDLPDVLCKYVPAEYAFKSVEEHTVRFSSIEYYNLKFDASEGMMPIQDDLNLDDYFEIVQARVIGSYLKEHHLDIDSISQRCTDILHKNFFGGCFTEKPLSEDMWRTYGGGNGICIQFEPDYSKLHRIVYSKELEKASLLRKTFMDINRRLAKEPFDSVVNDIDNYLASVIDVSIMSCYTKNQHYRDEHEFRMLIHKDDCPFDILKDEKNDTEYINASIPGRIVKIVSRMSEENNTALKTLADQNIEICKDQ